jgi:hypothetical protein
MRPCDIRGANQFETLTGFHLFSETRSTLVATHLDQSNYLGNQQQALCLAVPLHQPHRQTVKKCLAKTILLSQTDVF